MDKSREASMIQLVSQPAALRRAAQLVLGALLLSLLAACGGTSAVQAPPSPPLATTISTSIPTAIYTPTKVPATAAPTSAPTATTAPTSLPMATAAPTSIPTTSPATSEADAIKAVIQRAN